MRTRNFIRQTALVIPFLVIFYFPIAASIYNGLCKTSIDWNQGLQGLANSEEELKFNWNFKTWWQGTFQEGFAKLCENYCPGRAFSLRLFNQVDYSIFRSSYMLQDTLAIGRNNHLFQKPYLLDAAGQEVVPPDLVPRLMDKLEGIKTQLGKQGKNLLIVTTPSKAITYPMTLPDRFYDYDHLYPRAYAELDKALKASDIPFVDGAEILHAYSKSSPYPLFVPGGDHWDSYAAAILLPSITEKISQLTHKPLSAPTVTKVTMTKADRSRSPNIQNTDLAELLNVFWPPIGFEYPEITMNYPTRPPGSTPLFVLAGDSFSWHLIELLEGPPAQGYPRLAIAFYSKDFFVDTFNHGVSRKLYEKALASSDLMVVEMNELVHNANIDGLPSIIDESGHVQASSRCQISFAEGGNSGDYVWSGFSFQEPSFRWTDGNDAVLKIDFPPNAQMYTLAASVVPLLYGVQTHQRVEIRVDDKLCGSADLKKGGLQTINAIFSASKVKDIDFNFPDAISPAELKMNPDPRKLALAFYSLQIAPQKSDP
jgi:hypothetical protein